MLGVTGSVPVGEVIETSTFCIQTNRLGNGGIGQTYLDTAC